MDASDWTGWWFTRVALQTFVCLALGALAAARFRSTPARAHAVLVLAFAAAVLTTVASRAVEAVNCGAFVGPPPATTYHLAGEPKPVPPDTAALAGRVAAVAWAAGAGLLLLGLAAGYVRARRLVGRGDPVRDARLLAALASAREALGLRCEPRLVASTEVPAPLVWCWGRTPVVVIPAESPDQPGVLDWSGVFAHELAHVRRRDNLSALFADVVAAALFWNPAAWLGRRQLAWAAEFACDDRVAAAGYSPVNLAHALLVLRRGALASRLQAPGFLGARATLKARVLRLLRVSEPPPAYGRAWGLAGIALAAAFVFGLSVAQTRHGPPSDAACWSAVVTSSDGAAVP